MTLQDVFEKAQSLPLIERRELIKRLIDTLVTEETESLPKKHNLRELRGLGKEIWAGIDVQKYIDQQRDEWDARS